MGKLLQPRQTVMCDPIHNIDCYESGHTELLFGCLKHSHRFDKSPSHNCKSDMSGFCVKLEVLFCVAFCFVSFKVPQFGHCHRIFLEEC